jgi:hypothetical protein
MKKILYLFGIVLVLTLASCSFFGSKEAPESADTTAVQVDSVAVDSAANADTTKIMVTP